jgi:Tfp pilus assembly protein PilO
MGLLAMIVCALAIDAVAFGWSTMQQKAPKLDWLTDKEDGLERTVQKFNMKIAHLQHKQQILIERESH